MLEPRMLRRRKNPPGGLQLMDLTQTLQPWMVDQLSLASLASSASRRKGYVAVQRIVSETFVGIIAHGANYAAIPSMRPSVVTAPG
jgi:hypothetical protein